MLEGMCYVTAFWCIPTSVGIQCLHFCAELESGIAVNSISTHTDKKLHGINKTCSVQLLQTHSDSDFKQWKQRKPSIALIYLF